MILGYSLVIGCSLMHIFCCGIPLITTIIGLSTTIGFASSGILDNVLFESFEKFETEILLLSGIILATAFFLKFKAKNLDCCDEEAKKLCNINSKANNILLTISSILYLFTVSTFTLEAII